MSFYSVEWRNESSSEEKNGIGIDITASLSLITTNMSTFKNWPFQAKRSDVKQLANHRREINAALNAHWLCCLDSVLSISALVETIGQEWNLSSVGWSSRSMFVLSCGGSSLKKRSDWIESLLLPLSPVWFRWVMSVHCSFVRSSSSSVSPSKCGCSFSALNAVHQFSECCSFGDWSDWFGCHLPIDLFTCATRRSCWLPSFATLERVFITVFLNKQGFVEQAEMGRHEGVNSIWAHSFYCWWWTRLRWAMTHYAVCVCWRERAASVSSASVLRLRVPLEERKCFFVFSRLISYEERWALSTCLPREQRNDHSTCCVSSSISLLQSAISQLFSALSNKDL